VAPYARRLFHQIGIPDEIDGIPPAVALQHQRGTPTTRSSLGSVTTLSNLLRMLYSRAGDYPPGQPIIYAEAFSPNTPEGACPECHGHGRIYTITEQSRVPDPSLGAASLPEKRTADARASHDPQMQLAPPLAVESDGKEG
jgi:excinuclease ABC subunit A